VVPRFATTIPAASSVQNPAVAELGELNIPKATRPVDEEIIGITDEVCAKLLDAEYAPNSARCPYPLPGIGRSGVGGHIVCGGFHVRRSAPAIKYGKTPAQVILAPHPARSLRDPEIPTDFEGTQKASFRAEREPVAYRVEQAAERAA
jgi:hypothetical protein